MKNKITGFSYHISIEKIREYKKMPLENRLIWLYQANLLRLHYPEDIIRVQDKFRSGEI